MHVPSTIREDWQTEENEERWDDGHDGVLMECAYLIHRLLLHDLLFKCFFSFADSGKIWCRIRAEKRDSKIVRHLVKRSTNSVPPSRISLFQAEKNKRGITELTLLPRCF